MIDELKRKCISNDWKYNNFTCYLLESGRTAGSMAVLFGCTNSITHYWLHNDLSTAVNVLFLLARKVKLMKNIDIFDFL